MDDYMLQPFSDFGLSFPTRVDMINNQNNYVDLQKNTYLAFCLEPSVKF